MALKNKDGTPFFVRKPNPLMVNQRLWDGKGVMHNKVGRVVVFPDPRRPAPPAEAPTPPAVEREMVAVWCLPAAEKEVKDQLYGETFTRLTYGQKFKFQAVLVEEGLMSLVLWAQTRSVPVRSVIFPQTQDKRWWRVDEMKPDGGGHLYHAIPSDYHPDFSDPP